MRRNFSGSAGCGRLFGLVSDSSLLPAAGFTVAVVAQGPTAPQLALAEMTSAMSRFLKLLKTNSKYKKIPKMFMK